ncbi:MAG: chemotaxis protein CheD [Desulfobacterales bacterium]|nr:chemotaxis protein CheD [Desulfobacterales bacterium]
MNRIFDHKLKKERIIIDPGEYYVTSSDQIIYTVLGSCVSVCLIDKKANLYGMNHFMLPNSAEKIFFKKGEFAKYGANAMDLLIRRMLNRGADKYELTAKVFGGGHVLNFNGSGADVPINNIAFAIQYLEKAGINIESMDVGGTLPRRVFFYTETGEVHLSYIKERTILI